VCSSDLEALLQQLNASNLPFTLRLGGLLDIFADFETKASLFGELRDPQGMAYVLPGVLSARTYLKQANTRAQVLLERYAEPLVALAWWSGFEQDDPRRALGHAWKSLLLNHPHDSICGCSVDQVHREMLPRFAACHQLAEEALAEAVGVYHRPVTQPKLFIYNPAPVVFEGWVDFRVVWAENGGQEPPKLIELRTSTGQRPPLLLRSVRTEPQFHAGLDVLPDWYPARVYEGTVWLQLPPAGGVQLTAVAGDPAPLDTSQTELRATDTSLENAWLHLKIEAGRMHLCDKRTGRWYSDVHRFVDEADTGDTYNFSPLPADVPLALAVVATRLLPEQNPLERTLEVTYELEAPLSLSPDRLRRGGETAPLQVISRFTLRPGCRSVAVESTVEHQHQDHRLRLFSGGVSAAAEFFTDGVFGVFARPDKESSPLPVAKGHEAVMPEVPTGNFTMLIDSDGAGIAIAAEGLHEASLHRGAERADLAITCLRAVGWLSRDDLQTRGGGAGPRFQTPDAQCPGRHSFRYALIPVQNPQLDALRGAWALLAPPRGWCGEGPGMEGPLVTWDDQRIVISACKRSENGNAVVLRAYNPWPIHVETVMTILAPGAAFAPANLAEEPTDEFSSTRTPRVTFQPYEIKTWLLRKEAATD
jgi:hypothetical protein